MATRIALPARVPIGRVKVGGETLMVYATEDWSRALRVIVDNVNAIEAGITAAEVSNVPAGSIAAATVQDAINELDTEKASAASVTAALAGKQPLDATLTAIAATATAADKLLYFTGVDTTGTTDFSAFARTLLDDANAGAALTTLGVSAFAQTILDDANAGAALTTLGVSAFAQTILDDANAAAARTTLGVVIGTDVQAYDADLTAWAGKTAPTGDAVGTTDTQTLTNKALTSPDIDGGTVDNAPIGATTPNTGKFTSVESTSYVKTASTTFASLPAAGTAGAGARHFITDCNSTTFLAVAAAGGGNKVPVVSDGVNWLIG